MAFALQGLDDALLVRRGEAGEDVRGFHRLGQLRVGHGLDLAAEHDLLGIDADLGADLAGDQVVVAGQHLDGDAVLAQHGDGLGGGVLGRVEEGEVAGQDQVAFVGLGIGGLLLHLLGGDGQHAEAVLAQVVDLLDEVADQDGLHREDLALALEMGALGEDRLRARLWSAVARWPSGPSTTTDIMRREKSKGISSTLLYLSSESSSCRSWCCRTARSSTFLRPVWKWLMR